MQTSTLLNLLLDYSSSLLICCVCFMQFIADQWSAGRRGVQHNKILRENISVTFLTVYCYDYSTSLLLISYCAQFINETLL